MHNVFLPESKNKHKDKMETCDARKGAASRGVMEVFDITMLVAGWWPAAFREHQGWQVALRSDTFTPEEKYIRIYIASLLQILPKQCWMPLGWQTL